jgi:hypothetical protein
MEIRRLQTSLLIVSLRCLDFNYRSLLKNDPETKLKAVSVEREGGRG